MEYYVDKFNRRLKPKTKDKQVQVVSGGGVGGVGGVGGGMSLETDGWDAKKRKITNVEKGTTLGDVVTIDQTLITSPSGGFQHGSDNYNIIKSGVDLNMDNKKITNLSNGTDKSDAVAFGQVITNNGKWWNAKSMQIGKVANGTAANDVVNVSQFLNSMRLKSLGTKKAPLVVFNADGRTISNVKQGTLATDAAIISQIPTDYMKNVNNKWDAKTQPITDVKEGALPTDAATVSQIPTDYMKIVASKWDAKHQPITNVKVGVDPSDAVVMRQALTYAGGHLFECGTNLYDLTSLKK